MQCKCYNLSKLYTYTHTQFSCDNLSVASIVILMLAVCILFLVPHHPAAQTVNIPDPGLRTVIESALGKEAGADITQTDMESLESLDAFDAGVHNLIGLEFATNLVEMRFGNNKISDVLPLKALTNLTWLSIKGNRISNISPLKNLTNLTYLHIGYNRISDVTPLKNLTKLIFLELDENRISDISPLKNLINLTELYLDDNDITDVSPLENMTKLTKLNLNDNKISDITILKYFTNLTFLDIHGNQISNMLSLKNMEELRVLNFHENQIQNMDPLKNLKKLNVLKCDDNKISNVVPLQNLTNLTMLDLSGNKISNVAPLKNLTKLTVLDLSHNHISDFSPITDLIDNLIEYDFNNQTEPPLSFADVNRDGTVNIADLVAIAVNFSEPDFDALARMNIYPDVNGDGLVNLIDLLIAASEIDANAAAPTLSKKQIETSNLTAKHFTTWIRRAKKLNLTEPNLQRGIDVLEYLLAILSTQDEFPKTTALGPNYPNPFNPETWIPFQLSKHADVILRIYSVNGTGVRTLVLGHQPAGIYHHKSRAVYWDGKNDAGELVASGIYFYTLTAGEFASTRKMLIRK